MNTYDIAALLMKKLDARCRIGWVDWSSNSWDHRECLRRAWRIKQRIQGIHTNHHGDPL